MDACLAARPDEGAVDRRLAMTGRMRVALPPSADDHARRSQLIGLARSHASGGLPGSVSLVDELRALAGDLLASPSDDDPAFAVTLLAECARYDAVAGKPDTRVATMLAHAARSTDPVARFRAHRIAFACALSNGDLEGACRRAEGAYRAGRAAGDIASRFESLMLVVLLLETMGLWRHARDLARDLTRWNAGSDVLATLHLANATHGLRISQRLDDLASATYFHTMVRDAVESHRFEGLAAAAGSAAVAGHQLWIGKPRSATRAVESARTLPSVADHPRASAILHGVDCDVRIAVGDQDAIRRAIVALDALIPRFAVTSPIHQALLCASIKLELARVCDSEIRTGSAALERYRLRPDAARPVAVGVDFLWWVASESEASGSMSSRSQDDAIAGRHPSLAEIGFDVDDFIDRAAHRCAAENEASRRTPHYDVAEGWAIAAEIAAGGTGRQCFKVGRVAAALGAALGFSDERCAMLDMGCRLRDFGRSVVDCVAGDDGTRVHHTRVHAEHARAADRMLSFSSDPVLRLARLIAAHRRAWWNGSGFPGGLGGDAIPVEARICTVADALVEMVDPLDGARRWPIDQAVRQIGCLAGVQFDPTLVGLLENVLRYARPDAGDATWRLRPVRAEGSMAKAKQYLFETLELVDESVPASN